MNNQYYFKHYLHYLQWNCKLQIFGFHYLFVSILSDTYRYGVPTGKCNVADFNLLNQGAV